MSLTYGGAFIVALCHFGAVADPFLGSWTLDPSRSEVRTGLRLTIEIRGEAFQYSSGGIQYTALMDGEQYPLKGLSTKASVSLRRIDERTIERTYYRDGAPVSGATLTVTADGRFLTVKSRRLDPAGKGRELTSIYQGAPAGAGRDPFAGTWDRNPVRMIGNSPEGITFEAFGEKGLHLVGGAIEYSAAADGKDYKALGTIVANSISLERIDSHTVKEVWKDGSKTAATVKRVISADGSEMTATVTGITPQGDHFENIFVYRRVMQ